MNQLIITVDKPKQMKKQDLWKAIQDYNFEKLVPTSMWAEVKHAFGGKHPSLQAFAAKLMYKQGWDKPFALRAIEEYKRFVYLGIVSESSVTPSKILDEVWHQHILFTRGYQDFCSKTLKTNFDHFPEIMKSKSQSVSYDKEFIKTLSLYEKEFGGLPPVDIWGAECRAKIARETSGDKKKYEGKVSETYDDTPLYMLMASCGSSVDVSPSSNNSNNDSGFSGYGGGSFGGGGASASFASSDTSSHSSHSYSSGSSCSSASSCGSSCGSGCGGGCGS